MSDYERILNLRKFVHYWLSEANKICSKKDVKKIVKIFEKHTKGIPPMARYSDENASESYGFYISLLRTSKYDTNPKPFFDLLEIDYKIGWANPADVESRVFYWKGLKLIKDENVRFKVIKYKFL